MFERQPYESDATYYERVNRNATWEAIQFNRDYSVIADY